MNKNGFYIKKLQVLGNNVETAEVTFTKGLNVIYGDSDTGKSFIYECIDYMLGASKIPKVSIEEAKGYTLCRLEIESLSTQKTYILERSLQGGNITLQGQKKPLYVGKVKSKTISDLLLELCNIENKKIRRNQKGETDNLYFNTLKRIFLVDEERIITKHSIIHSGQYTEETKDKNLFKFIFSEEDDSAIVPLLKTEEENNKKGKIDLYNEIISELKDEMSDEKYNNIEESIQVLNNKVENLQNIYSISNEEFQEYDSRQKLLYKEILKYKAEIININEILKRSSILKKQYTNDILRLEASQEAGSNFSLFSTSRCPMCSSEVSSLNILNYQNFVEASKVEIEKINLRLKELNESQQIFINDKNDILEKLSTIEKEHSSLLDDIENRFSNKLEELSTQIKEFSIEREELTRIKVLKDKFDMYLTKQGVIQDILDNNSMEYKELEVELFVPIMQIMENILIAIKFDRKHTVSYSEKELDFIIGEQKRGDFGKGYRAILYAVFIISMLEYLRTKPYQIGFTMIDSPLNPYKRDEEDDGDKLSDNLANNFYRYLAKNIKDEQVILIENTPIPDDIVDEVNYRKFIKGNGFLKG
ncbi:MAG: hypothetical protein K0U38_01360 [Epsilonproteobacteria bacterium]|nr:hypothetical protein [Campylobacterota bacterium]